jgi:hypothetical protein
MNQPYEFGQSGTDSPGARAGDETAGEDQDGGGGGGQQREQMQEHCNDFPGITR